MNNTTSTHPIVLSLKVLWLWLMAKPGRPSEHTTQTIVSAQRVHSPSRCEPSAIPVHQTPMPVVSGQKPSPSRSVRVLQVMDAGQSPAQFGRLRISGRMADVCAELDRLAACEAMQH